MKTLLIDNYDSFTFNLYQYLSELGTTVDVLRNDNVDFEKIKDHVYSQIVISPGPGDPQSAGSTLEVIKSFAGHLPIFGVCLGHQAIGEAFGGTVIRAPRLMHGKISKISHDKKGVFAGITKKFVATRYHSLIVSQKNLPRDLIITAKTDDGIIMGLRHKRFKVEGVQFHPESIMTEHGKKILRNFLKMKERLELKR